MKLDISVYRFDPERDREPRFQDYTVEVEPAQRILDCLNIIRWEQDGTLSFRLSCAHGVCGSCAMKINGRCALACQKLAREYEGQKVVIEPLPSFTVLKDLIVDMDPFLARVAQIRPYLIAAGDPPEAERRQSPEEQKKIDQVIRCILCACCSASCPVAVDENPRFLGPAPLVQAFRRIFDSRDSQTAERLAAVDGPNGAFGCVNHFECTKVCPKEILVTKSINFIKREIEKNRPQT